MSWNPEGALENPEGVGGKPRSRQKAGGREREEGVNRKQGREKSTVSNVEDSSKMRINMFVGFDNKEVTVNLGVGGGSQTQMWAHEDVERRGWLLLCEAGLRRRGVT